MSATQSHAYKARNISFDELSEFGCDVFSYSKSHTSSHDANYEVDHDGIVSIMDDQDIDYIRHFH